MASSAVIAYTIMTLALAQTDTTNEVAPQRHRLRAPAAPALQHQLLKHRPRLRPIKKEISLEDWNRDDWMLLKRTLFAGD